MKAKGRHRGKDHVENEVLDALVDRGHEGMTVLELRASVDADIDTIESVLSDLKREDLICVSQASETTVIKPDDQVMPTPPNATTDPSILERIRDRLPF